MATFSGFLSSFTQSSGTNDIMSSFNSYVATCIGGNAVGTYNAGYMYIGDLLIQFTYLYPNGTEILPTTDSGDSNITINFPISYTPSIPYCVLTSPYSDSQSNYTITVSNIQSGSFNAHTGNGNYGSIQYIAIGPKPT